MIGYEFSDDERRQMVWDDAAERDQMRTELRAILSAADASQWHDRAGEQVKRIALAPSVIERIRSLVASGL